MAGGLFTLKGETMLYIKSTLIGATTQTVQGYCDNTGTTLLSGIAIPYYRAGEKVEVVVKVVGGWSIPVGAVVDIRADSVMDAVQTPAMAIGKAAWIDYANNEVHFILDCDQDAFYAYTDKQNNGLSFFVQFTFRWYEDVSTSPEPSQDDREQVLRLVATSRAYPAVSSTGGGPLEPVYVTAEGLATTLDASIAEHNTAVGAHEDIRTLLSNKSYSDHNHDGVYVDSYAPGNTLATLVDGKVPLNQLPDSIGGASVSGDNPLLSNETPDPLGALAWCGVGPQASRDDHVHQLPTYTDVGAAAVDHVHPEYAGSYEITQAVAAHNDGNKESGIHQDIWYAIGALEIGTASNLTPLSLDTPGSPGASSELSRYDHRHPMPDAADVGAATAADVSTAVSNHNVSGSAHSDIRTLVSDSVAAHNVGGSAHSDIRALVAAKVSSSLLGVASGVATLDSSGYVPAAQVHQKWTATLACSDLVTDLVAGTAVAYFRVAGAKTLTAVRGALYAPAGGSTKVTVNINVNGSSCLSSLISFNAGETTSKTAAFQPAVSAGKSAIPDDARITVNIISVGNTTAGKGLTVTLEGYEA